MKGETSLIANKENGKRFWYAISSVKDTTITAVKNDGTKENVEEIDEELLKNQKK